MKSSTKYLKIVVNYVLTFAIVAACIWLLPKLLSFFLPFVIAGIIAFIANPLVRFLENKLKIKRKAGSVVVIVLTLALVGGICYLIVYLLVTEAGGFIGSLPQTWRTVSNTIRGILEDLSARFGNLGIGDRVWIVDVENNVSSWLTDWGTSIGTVAAESAGNSVKNIPLLIVGAIMCVLASYLFVAQRDHMAEVAVKVIPESIRDRFTLVYNTMKKAVGGYFKAQFKIMFFVYLILLVGFLILGIKYSFLIALLIAFLDFLPFFGTGAVMWPWAAIAFFDRDYKLAIGMLVVWGASQLVRQLIQPKLVGDSVGMAPIPTLFLLYIGFRVGGALGLIIAIPVGMIVYNLYKAGLFSNFIYSTRILIKDIRRLRVFTKRELASVGIKKTETGMADEQDAEDDRNVTEDSDK